MLKSEHRRVLVIAPHADDEVYGMGGTIMKLVASGATVRVVVVCAGNVSFEHLSGTVVTRDDRIREIKAVSEAMGVSWVSPLFNQDSAMDTVPIKDVIGFIESCSDEFMPTDWYVSGPSFHQDHRVVFEATMAAARPSRKHVPNSIFMYETPLYSWSTDGWRMAPNVYEDITGYIDRKIEVSRLYKSQVRDKGPLSPERIRSWAEYCGSEVNIMAAERFQLIRSLVR